MQNQNFNFAEGDPEIVAVLLEKLSETPEGSPVALADKVSVQLELNVYTTFVMAVLAVTV